MGDFDGITVDGKSVEECIETEKSKDIRKTLESTLSSQIRILPKIGKIRFPEAKERNSKVYNYTATEIRRMNMKSTPSEHVSAIQEIMQIFSTNPSVWFTFNDILLHLKNKGCAYIPKGTVSGILSKIKNLGVDQFEIMDLRDAGVNKRGSKYSLKDGDYLASDLVKAYNEKQRLILKKAVKLKVNKRAFLGKVVDHVIPEVKKEVIDNNSNLSAQYLIDFIEGIKRMGLKVDININITS